MTNRISPSLVAVATAAPLAFVGLLAVPAGAGDETAHRVRPLVRAADATGGTTADAEDPALTAALLAIEEAELRERMVTALAIAEGVRLKGRTVLVALSELRRVRRVLSELSPTDPRRRRLETRIDALEAKRRAVGEEVDREFRGYLDIVGEISTDLWPRLDRVGGVLEKTLTDRRLENLTELLPLMRGHVEELNREGSLSTDAAERWRREVDDTFETRRDIVEGRRTAPKAPSRDPDEDRDI